MRILSGIQPSGTLHLGNYFGMMKPAIELQEKGEAFYFIANYHSMTSLVDPAERRQNTLDVALDFLACGLDPKTTVFFRQSDVPEVTELTWMLEHGDADGPAGALHSATRTRSPRAFRPTLGLFAYPVLMAADILIYDSNVVPVGQDQKQHVEVTRDIAIKFNEQYGETFVIPEPQIRAETAKVPGLDGEKMSKSYGNTIEIFGDEKALRKKVMGIKMDSRTPAGAQARCRPEPRHPNPEAGRAARRGEGLRGPAARRRPGLRRPEEGALRALLELLRRCARQTRRVGGEPGLRQQGPGRRRTRARASPARSCTGRRSPVG